MSLKIGPNNFRTTVAAQLLVGGTSLTVANATPLGVIAPGDWYLLTLVRISAGIETAWEIVRVTARAGNVLSITRAQESTTALQWEIGENIEARITNGMLLTFQGGNTISQYFSTSDLPISVGALQTIAHGLGVQPKLVQIYLKCSVAVQGWIPGDMVLYQPDMQSSRCVQAGFDAVNVYVFVSATGTLVIQSKATGGIFNVTNADFKLVVRAIV